MSEAHARLGPSNHRWVYCPGSVREENGYEDIAGAAAIDGTGSHLLLELCLVNGVRAEDYEGHIIGENHEDCPNGWMIHLDRCDRVQECLDYVARRYNELSEKYPQHKVSIYAEGKSNPGEAYGRDDWWGTVDITILVTDGDNLIFIETCDYKDGRGWVSVKNKDNTYNSQLVSYCGGKMKDYLSMKLPRQWMEPYSVDRVEGCRLSVVQPRTNPTVRYEDLQPSTLMSEMDRLAKAAEATDDPNAPVIPGKHCQWCKANPKRGGHCTAESQQSLQVVSEMSSNELIASDQSLFELINGQLTDMKSLPSEKLSQLADARASLIAIFDRVEDEIAERLESGQQVPGYTMKPGRGSKVWNADEEEIAKALKSRRMKKDDIYPAKLLSPAQMLKSDKLTDDQKKKLEDKFITFKAGKLKPTKVAHGDEMSAEEMFKDVSENKSSDNVAQSNTHVIESAPSVFEEPKPETQTEEISFF